MSERLINVEVVQPERKQGKGKENKIDVRPEYPACLMQRFRCPVYSRDSSFASVINKQDFRVS